MGKFSDQFADKLLPQPILLQADVLVVGIAAAVIGLVLLFAGSRSRSTMKESTQETPTGQVRTQERFDSGSDL